MNIDSGYVQAGVILVINLAVVAAGGGALSASVSALTARVKRIEGRLDRIYELLLERGKDK